MRQHPRVLLCAYQCGPGMGSVSQIGWEWFSRLSQRVPTTLVTHIRNRPALSAALGETDSDDILYIDTEWLAGPLYRLARRLFPRSEHATFLLSSADFYLYDAVASRRLRRIQAREQRWDLVHAVTPVSPVAATRLHRVGLPLVLGPWNGGGLEWPPGFPEFRREDSGWLYPVRHLGRFFDLFAGASRHAAAILSATQATTESVPRRHHHRIVPMLENGVDLERFRSLPWPAPASAKEPLRIVFVGRLVPFKGLPMLFDALAQLRDEFPIALRVVGEGPMDEPWRQQVRKLGLEAEVSFAGALPADEVAREVEDCHVFCLPSVRESGGAVLLEAMACARPVIALQHGGPGELVDDGVGRCIAPEGPDFVTEALAETLREIVREPETWRRRGLEGRQRAELRFGWDAKVEEAIRLYQRLGGVGAG